MGSSPFASPFVLFAAAFLLIPAITACGESRPVTITGDGGPAGGRGSDGGPLPSFECEVEDLGLLDRGGLSAASLTLAAATDGALLYWVESSGEGERAQARFLPRRGLPGRVHPIDTAADPTREPTAIFTGEGFLVAHARDAGADGVDVALAALEIDGSPRRGPVAIARGPEDQDQPRLLSTDAGFALVHREGDGATRALRITPLDMLGATTGAIRDLLDRSAAAGPIAAARTGPGIALAYRESQSLRIFWLDGTGSPLRSTPQRIEGAAPTGAPDVATRRGSDGAVIFGASILGAREEVRIALLDDQGALLAPPLTLTEPPDEGRGPSIDAFAGGYVVAHVAEEGGDTPKARLSLVDVRGLVGAEIDLATTSAATQRVEVAVATDGTVIAAWLDRGPSTLDLRAARLVCGAQ